MKRRKRFEVIGMFERCDGFTVGVVLWRGFFWGLTYAGSNVTAADVAGDFERLGTSKFFYGFAPVNPYGVYNSPRTDESLKRKEGETQ